MIATTTRPAAGVDLAAAADEILNRHPNVGFAVGVVRDGRLDSFYSHGVGDITTQVPVTEDTVFRIASITKTFTAVAVMQLWERGLVDLDAPANSYLRAFRLSPRRLDFRPPTVRHLLTHTAGLPEMVHPSRALMYVYGESVAMGRRVPPLAEYYRGGLPVVEQPGTRFAYTDHSFSTLGQIVEDVSGEPLAEYFRRHILEPLRMTDTGFERTRFDSRRATGYTYGPRGPKPVVDRQWVTAAASMLYSTPRDLARYVAALLAGGAGENGSVLKPQTVATMFDPQYQPHPLIPGIGLAFSRFNFGGHRVVDHGGVLPGFNSQIYLAPDDGIGVIAFTNGTRQGMFWLPAETGALLSRVIGVREPAIRSDVPQHPEVWADLCGRYGLSAGVADTRARAMIGLGADVFVRRGKLVLRGLSPIPALYRGFELHPDDFEDPFVFRIDISAYGMGTARVIFGRDATGHAATANLDVYPLTLHKRPAPPRGRRRAAFILGAAGAAGAAAGAVAITRRRRAAL